MLLAGGVGGLVTVGLAAAASTVPPSNWWIVGALILVGIVLLGINWLRRRQLDARVWDTEQWDHLRQNEYRRREGLFLIHSAIPYQHPTDDTREWWTVTIQLAQHGSGPLSNEEIKHVVYSFGPKFDEGPHPRQNPQDNFRYETELHGSVLVLGRVIFKSWRKRPLIVERYIDVPPR